MSRNKKSDSFIFYNFKLESSIKGMKKKAKCTNSNPHTLSYQIAVHPMKRTWMP